MVVKTAGGKGEEGDAGNMGVWAYIEAEEVADMMIEDVTEALVERGMPVDGDADALRQQLIEAILVENAGEDSGVCERETERQRDRETERQRDRETERQGEQGYDCGGCGKDPCVCMHVCMCVCVCVCACVCVRVCV